MAQKRMMVSPCWLALITHGPLSGGMWPARRISKVNDTTRRVALCAPSPPAPEPLTGTARLDASFARRGRKWRSALPLLFFDLFSCSYGVRPAQPLSLAITLPPCSVGFKGPQLVPLIKSILYGHGPSAVFESARPNGQRKKDSRWLSAMLYNNARSAQWVA
jgi:hypothetical protein